MVCMESLLPRNIENIRVAAGEDISLARDGVHEAIVHAMKA